MRMGRTPNSRREEGYNARLPHPGRPWDQIYSYTGVGMHRQSMVNFTRAFNRSSPRIEFRFPDASHDPGVIQGQVKSGPRHRPMDPSWARAIRDLCLADDVPFFFKQWGGRTPKAEGRLLDGRFWDQMPSAPGHVPTAGDTGTVRVAAG